MTVAATNRSLPERDVVLDVPTCDVPLSPEFGIIEDADPLSEVSNFRQDLPVSICHGPFGPWEREKVRMSALTLSRFWRRGYSLIVEMTRALLKWSIF